MTGLAERPTTATHEDRPSWGRGVLASYDNVTPARSDDATRLKLTLRDFIIAALAIAGTWGLQVATTERYQGKTTAAIENLATKFDGYVQQQSNTNGSLQRQIDEIRRRAEQGVVYGVEAEKEAARLEGIMLGAGVKERAK